MARKRKVQRIGKRLAKVEQLWSELPKEQRTEGVLLKLCEAAGIDREQAKERFRLALGMLDAHHPGTH
jgi:hypothetical protein